MPERGARRQSPSHPDEWSTTLWHRWIAGTWNTFDECIFVAVDFANAYDCIRHPFTVATPRYFIIPSPYIRLLVHLMCSNLVVTRGFSHVAAILQSSFPQPVLQSG